MTTPPYTYRAVVLAVVDGDTVDLETRLARSRGKDRDYGFHVYRRGGWLVRHDRFRLLGLNAPDLHPAKDDATAYLRGMLPLGSEVGIATERDRTEKYGRFLVTITRDADKPLTVNAQLVSTGHALSWDGTGHRPE